MRKIYLTIDVDCEDEAFHKMGKMRMLNYGKLLQAQKVKSSPETQVLLREHLVAQFLLENEEDVLLGFAVQEKGQLTHIIDALSKEGKVEKLYYDNGLRKKAALKAYTENYAQHSRWMDNSPDYVKHQYEEFDKRIEEIIGEAVKHGVDVVAI